uniref:Uncharacterized protein n=1 Tax=Lutzomyia longipalpis TaxID=7200 RepID=A0A1B0CF01_LUTLO
MNFIKKLAKDLQISKRRHSAPVLVDEPHKYKEEQYKQALQAFTGWRAENVGGSSQSQMERINEEEGHELLKGSSSSGEKSSPTYADIEENDGEDHSPPEGFFRTNSIPDLAKSPQKSTAIGQRKTSKRSHNKGPAPAPPIFAFNRNAQLTRNKKTSNITKSCFQPMSSEMEGEDTDRSGCYKRYHLDSLTGDEGIHNEGMIMSQKNYPPPHLVDLPDEEEEAPVFSPRNDVKKPPRKAQRADKIIKKSPKISSVKSPRSAEFNEVIDEGFQFLQDNYGNLIDTTVEGSQAGVRSNVPVTDLDKSDPPSLNEEDDIRRALSLFLVDAIDAYDERANKEKIWGQQTMDASVFDPFYTRFQDFYRTQNVIVCWPNEVTYQKGSPRSTMITPLDFWKGIIPQYASCCARVHDWGTSGV